MPPDSETMTVAEEMAELRAERDRLVAERDGERRRADEEARRADGLTATVSDNTRQIAESTVANLGALEQQATASVAAITSDIQGLKSQQANLFAEGKFEEATELSEKIGDATARRQEASRAQTYYAQQREQASKQPANPLDRFFAANPRIPEADREWIRRHPRYATDEQFRDRVNTAHADALANGIERQSAEYFQHLELAGYMRPAVTPQPRARQQAQPDDGGDDDGPYSAAAESQEEPIVETRQRPQGRSMAASPSRRAPAVPGRQQSNGRDLTPEQAEMALAMSAHAPESVLEQGEPGIYKWWSDLNNSPMAQRRRAEWAGE